MIHLPRTPCPSCPLRRDTPPGIWVAEHYELLPEYDEHHFAVAPLHCHQENITGRPTLCRGLVSALGFKSVAVRIAVARGLITPEQVEAPCAVPLYSSGREACDAGLAGVESPSPAAARKIEQLQARMRRRKR